MKKAQYDVQKKSQAGVHVMLRCLVSGYLLYLAVKIAKGASASSMSVIAAWGIAAVFADAGLGFIIYALCRYRKDLRAALLPEDSEPPENPEP